MPVAHKIISDDGNLATRLATTQASAQAADRPDQISARVLGSLCDALAAVLAPGDLVNLAACSRELNAALRPSLVLQAPRHVHPQSVLAARPTRPLRAIGQETTLADSDPDFAALGLILGCSTIMAWSAHHVLHPVGRESAEDSFTRPTIRSLSIKPCVAMSRRHGNVIALPSAGAPYALQQELQPWPSPRPSPRGLWATPHADPMGRNLGFVPVGRHTALGSGWRVATEQGLRTFDVLGHDRCAPIHWPFHAIGAIGDANRLWVLDDAHHVHTWRDRGGTGLPDIAWEIPSARGEVPLWAAGAKGRLAVAYAGALTLASVDGVHAPLPWPPYVGTPTALAFLGQSYLALGDAKGQVTLCHWPSGRFSASFELGSINGHRFDDNDAVLAIISDRPQRLYTAQKSGILRRLSAPFAPDENEA